MESQMSILFVWGWICFCGICELLYFEIRPCQVSMDEVWVWRELNCHLPLGLNNIRPVCQAMKCLFPYHIYKWQSSKIQRITSLILNQNIASTLFIYCISRSTIKWEKKKTWSFSPQKKTLRFSTFLFGFRTGTECHNASMDSVRVPQSAISASMLGSDVEFCKKTDLNKINVSRINSHVVSHIQILYCAGLLLK